MTGPGLTLSAVASELARYGVQIIQLPGEYRVNHQQGREADAYHTEDLADALEHGRSLAGKPPPARPAAHHKRASRKAIIRRHNQKWAATRRRKAAKEDARTTAEAISRADDF